MIELSVGAAAALIALGVAVLQFLLPNALALVLTGSLSDTHSAVTWSVVSRFLLSSDWPLFIRSEATSSTSVPRKLALITWMKPVGLALAAIAAIVTPLGLHDSIEPLSHAQEVAFVYAPDLGPIGTGSPSRSDMGFQRICSYGLCPGEPDLGNVTLTTMGANRSYQYISRRVRSPWIPAQLVDLYQSGIEDDSSLCGFFDIQYRQWRAATSNYTAHNSSYMVPGTFRPIKTLILDDKVSVLDGVIANMVSGGIGFRNHSVPLGLQYGAEWEEDILYWEPDVECVNLNVTLNWNSTAYYTFTQDYQGLVDRGGFINLNRTSPYVTDFSTNSTFPWPNGQSHPGLYERAYFSAWELNALNMQFLNITTAPGNHSFPDTHTPLPQIRSSLGQKFPVDSLFTQNGRQDFPYFLRRDALNYLANVPSDLSGNRTRSGPYNPYNMTGDMYSTFQDYAEGFSPEPLVSDSRIASFVGMAAAPVRQVGGLSTTDLTDPTTQWEKDLYVCAAATKVSIKTFRFKYNSSSNNGLSGLSIVDFKDKDYTASRLPLWTLETPSSKWKAGDINPLWGLIDESHAKSPNLSIIQADHFYIPASSDAIWGYGLPTDSAINGDYVPAVSGPSLLWQNVLSGKSTGLFDYTGSNNQQLQEKWGNLIKNRTGMALAMKLMWTDLAANSLTGTKGIHNPRFKQPPVPTDRANTQRSTNGGANSVGTYPVHVLQRRLQYHWIYAIPALICVGVVGLACFFAIVAMVCGHGTVARLRYFMFHITSGRAFASFIYPESREDQQADTDEWIKVVGHKPVQLFGQTSGVDYNKNSDDKGKLKYIQVAQREDTDTLSSASR